jgi:hypothetical protein
MKLFGRDFQGFAKWLVVSATALLIASGLCGLQLAILNGSRGNSGNLQGVFMLTGLAELAVMVPSAICVLCVAIAWPISFLVRRRLTRFIWIALGLLILSFGLWIIALNLR